MRRALFPLLLIALASPAVAQIKGKLTIPAPALRSAPAPGIEPEPPASLLPPAPAVPPFQAEAEARQCRLRCAQDLYLCQAGDLSESCGADWGQCRVRCDAASHS